MKKKCKKEKTTIKEKKEISIKQILIILKEFIIKYKKEIIISLPFLSMDLITRIFGMSTNFYGIYHIPPNLFTICWITLIIGLITNVKSLFGRILYITFDIISIFLFLLNNIYYSMTKTFFDFSLLESAGEGTPYILDAIKKCNPLVYIALIFIIVLSVIGFKNIEKKDKNNTYLLIRTFIIFLALHIITPFTLGFANKELTWSSWKNPKNIYISYNDSNKSLKVSGLYEYSVRNFYINFLKTQEIENEEDKNFLDEAFEEGTNKSNKYTGKFKDKNLIIVQLEGLDNWLLTEQDTKTLYNMKKNAINFNNHFSFYNGGGSTFNSEFAVNTGFITPLSYTRNAYSFNKNDFPYTLARLFKEKEYSVNAFHMNSGEYYSRTVNYKNWGYDNYYGLIDMFNYDDESYMLDRELILNEKFNELMFPTEGKFVDYIIAYSSHLPFTNTKGVCKQLYDLDYANDEEKLTNRIEMTEEDCARRQAKETDYMMELILKNLKEKNLLDNTVIVVFADHYLYTIDQSVIEKYKNTSNNLVNKTPFFIWSNNMKSKTINEVTSQLNILPTLLNLFGIKYNPNNYIFTDALDSKYSGLVFFSDYSWYDGNVYVENGEVTNKKKINKDKLEEKNYYVSNIAKKNDLALKFNYFKTKKKAD